MTAVTCVCFIHGLKKQIKVKAHKWQHLRSGEMDLDIIMKTTGNSIQLTWDKKYYGFDHC